MAPPIRVAVQRRPATSAQIRDTVLRSEEPGVDLVRVCHRLGALNPAAAPHGLVGTDVLADAGVGLLTVGRGGPDHELTDLTAL